MATGSGVIAAEGDFWPINSCMPACGCRRERTAIVGDGDRATASAEPVSESVESENIGWRGFSKCIRIYH